MRLCELDADQWIAEGIERVHAPMRFRLDVELVLEAFLVGSRTRHQMQQVMGVHHVGGVLVAGLVANPVFSAHR